MAGTKQTEPPDLVRAIEEAGAADKELIDRKIDELQKELDALKQASKVLEIKLNGKPVRNSTGRARGEVTEERRGMVFDYLATKAPAKPKAIAQACGIPVGSMAAVLDHEWFTKTPHGYRNATASPRRNQAGQTEEV